MELYNSIYTIQLFAFAYEVIRINANDFQYVNHQLINISK